jgi:hypothetical protein
MHNLHTLNTPCSRLRISGCEWRLTDIELRCGTIAMAQFAINLFRLTSGFRVEDGFGKILLLYRRLGLLSVDIAITAISYFWSSDSSQLIRFGVPSVQEYKCASTA